MAKKKQWELDEEEKKKKSDKLIKNIALGGAVILLILALISVFSNTGETNTPSINLDSFARCIAESGAKMYGASWCSHCNNQKEVFKDSWDLMKDSVYVECDSTSDGQTQECKDEEIRGYPTWRFSNGVELGGFLTFPMIAEQTGCELI